MDAEVGEKGRWAAVSTYARGDTMCIRSCTGEEDLLAAVDGSVYSSPVSRPSSIQQEDNLVLWVVTAGKGFHREGDSSFLLHT